MALVLSEGIIVPPAFANIANVPLDIDDLIDAAGEKVAFIFRVPKTGTLDRVGFRTGTASNPQDLRVSFQNVSGNDPDGTQDEFRTVTSIAANTWFETGLITSDGTDGGVKRSVTVGDLLAVVIEFESTVGSVNIRGASSYFNNSFPYTNHFTASWAVDDNGPNLYLEYNDASTAVIFGTAPWTSQGTTAFNNGSTPDERALKWTPPFDCRVRGTWITADLDNAADIILYQGTTALATVTTGARGNVSIRTQYYSFPSTQVLNAGTAYYMALQPTSGSNVTLAEFTLDNAKHMNAWPLGNAAHLATRTDAGAWSDTTTIRPCIGFILDQLDDGAGGETSHVF